jgi:hypothetical protein
MLIKPMTFYKFITFFSFNLINPLTLLIIPIIGSLIILSYPFWLGSPEPSEATQQTKRLAGKGSLQFTVTSKAQALPARSEGPRYATGGEEKQSPSLHPSAQAPLTE